MLDFDFSSIFSPDFSRILLPGFGGQTTEIKTGKPAPTVASVKTPPANPTSSKPVIGTIWGYPGDGMDNGVTAWGISTKGEDRNILGVSLPTEGAYAVPISQVPLGGLVNVFSSQTGKTLTLPRIDKGPAAWTKNGVDLTFNAARALGLDPAEGKFAGLYVTPTGQTMSKTDVQREYNYTGFGWIAPGVKNAMTESSTSPIDWTGYGANPSQPGTLPPPPPLASLNPASWLDQKSVTKGLVTVGFGIAILVLTVSLLQDKTPIQVVTDTADNIKTGAKNAATVAVSG